MHLTVIGKKLDVGEALRTHVTDALNQIAEKYFSNPIDGTVVITREAHLFKVDINMHVGRGIQLKSEGEASEPYPAFETAADRIAKRLRRHKRRLRDHSKNVTGADGGMAAQQYILTADEPEDADGTSDDGLPVIIAEMATTIETMTVGEAVMRMDLGDMPAIMFRNSGHGELNMVYRRQDGHIGWVDPQGNQTGNG